MSTCVKIIFHEEGGGEDVRIGYDETSDATETELNYAKAYAQQITEIVRGVAGAEDLTKKCPRCGRRYFGHRKLCMRCLSPRKKFMRICRHCGKHFAASSNHFLVCPKCRKERLAAYMKDYMPRWREAHGKTTCNGGSLAPRKDGD